jgi:hypothetical protein
MFGGLAIVGAIGAGAVHGIARILTRRKGH